MLEKVYGDECLSGTEVYGDEFLSGTEVFEWFKLFKEGGDLIRSASLSSQHSRNRS